VVFRLFIFYFKIKIKIRFDLPFSGGRINAIIKITAQTNIPMTKKGNKKLFPPA